LDSGLETKLKGKDFIKIKILTFSPGRRKQKWDGEDECKEFKKYSSIFTSM